MNFIKKVTAHRDRKSLLSNFLNFVMFKASQYVVPLITMPYIIRVIGLEYFGLVSLAQTIAMYFKIGADYGWSILGVQYIARVQQDAQKKSEVVSNIFFIQFVLSTLGFILLALLTFFIGDLRSEWQVLFAAYIFVPANMMIAPWFFVGMEKVKFLNIVNLAGRLVYLALIFTLLRDKSQYVLVPLLNSLSLMIGGLLGIFVIVRQFRVRLVIPKISTVKKYLIDGWPIFLSYFATNLYRNMNILILALFTSKEMVGIFSAADKVVKIAQRTFEPITQTLYPYISRIKVESQQRAKRAIKYLTFIMGLLGGTTMLLIIGFAPWIIYIIVDQHSPLGTQILQIGSAVILFGVLNYVLGIIYMTNFGMKKQFSNSVILTGFVNLAVCFLLSYQFKATGAMISFAFSEGFLMILFIYHIDRHNKALSRKAVNG